jgi:hypothetical protein
MESRVEQVMRDNQDKKLLERISGHYLPSDLLLEVLVDQHKDIKKAAMLVPKIMAGCEEWLKDNTLPFGEDTQNIIRKQELKFSEDVSGAGDED